MENQLLILLGVFTESLAIIMLFSKFRKLDRIDKVNIMSWDNSNQDLNRAMNKLTEQLNELIEKKNKHNKDENENNKTWYIVLFLGIILQVSVAVFQLF